MMKIGLLTSTNTNMSENVQYNIRLIARQYFSIAWVDYITNRVHGWGGSSQVIFGDLHPFPLTIQSRTGFDKQKSHKTERTIKEQEAKQWHRWVVCDMWAMMGSGGIKGWTRSGTGAKLPHNPTVSWPPLLFVTLDVKTGIQIMSYSFWVAASYKQQINRLFIQATKSDCPTGVSQKPHWKVRCRNFQKKSLLCHIL